jgi:hypothetical protein
MGRRDERREPDVKVHLTKGCDLDGRKDQHTHTQKDHRAAVDAADPWKGR